MNQIYQETTQLRTDELRKRVKVGNLGDHMAAVLASIELSRAITLGGYHPETLSYEPNKFLFGRAELLLRMYGITEKYVHRQNYWSCYLEGVEMSEQDRKAIMWQAGYAEDRIADEIAHTDEDKAICKSELKRIEASWLANLKETQR